MPSKRCATSAKRSGNCSSAPVTNRMACQSRCEIRVQASRRRLLSACSRLSTRRSLAVWGWACRSAVRSSKRTAADCGRARTCPAAPAFNSPCRRSQTLRRDAALVSKNRQLDREYRCGSINRYRIQPFGPLPVCPEERTSPDQPGWSVSCRYCCRSRLKASANNDSLRLTRSTAGTGHDGPIGAGPRTAVLFVLP